MLTVSGWYKLHSTLGEPDSSFPCGRPGTALGLGRLFRGVPLVSIAKLSAFAIDFECGC